MLLFERYYAQSNRTGKAYMERTFLTENDIPAIHVYDAISFNVVADSMCGNFEEECVKLFGKPDSGGRNEDRLSAVSNGDGIPEIVKIELSKIKDKSIKFGLFGFYQDASDATRFRTEPYINILSQGNFYEKNLFAVTDRHEMDEYMRCLGNRTFPSLDTF